MNITEVQTSNKHFNEIILSVLNETAVVFVQKKDIRYFLRGAKTVVSQPKEIFLNENKFPHTIEHLAVTQTFAHYVLTVPISSTL